jgi:hypothetical protein
MSARKRMKVDDIWEWQLHGSEWSDSEGTGNDETGIWTAVSGDSVGNDKVTYWNDLCCEIGKAC